MATRPRELFTILRERFGEINSRAANDVYVGLPRREDDLTLVLSFRSTSCSAGESQVTIFGRIDELRSDQPRLDETSH